MRYLPFLLLLGCQPQPAPPPTATAAAGEMLSAETPAPVGPLRPGSDWPRFLGPNDDGSTPETDLAWTWPKDGPKKLWDCKLGLGYAPPAVAAGVLYHFDRFGDACRVTARNADTGEVRWTAAYETTYEDYYGYDPGPRAGPVIDGDRVYAYGPDGVLLCLDAADGKQLWKKELNREYRVHQNFFGVGSAPLIHGDLAIVAVGGSPPGPRPVDLREAKPNGTCFVAFEKKTGAPKYAAGNDLASYASPTVAKIRGQDTGLYFARGGLLGFDPATGKEKFRYPWRAKSLESVNAANPAVVGDRVLITECYGPGSAFVEITADGVKEVWTDRGKDDRCLAGHWCTPVVKDGFAYGCTGRHTPEGELRCIELATGDVKWAVKMRARGTLTRSGNRAVWLGEQGELRTFTLTPEKYSELSKFESPDLDFPSWAPPAISRGILYVRGKDKLVAFDVRK